MVFLWFSCGFPVVFLGFPMVFLWFSCSFPVVFLWFSLVFLWFSYGFPVVFLWFSCGFPMVFLWFSYGFSRSFPIGPMVISVRGATIGPVPQGLPPGGRPTANHILTSPSNIWEMYGILDIMEYKFSY